MSIYDKGTYVTLKRAGRKVSGCCIQTVVKGRGSCALQVAGAQVCWAVAGAPLHWAPAAGEAVRLTLVGADLAAAPQAARSIAALQRTQLYVWAMASGTATPPPPPPGGARCVAALAVH